MESKKISQLTPTGVLQDNGGIPIEQGGDNFKLIPSALLRSDKLLSEFDTTEKKTIARQNIGAPSASEVYTKIATDILFNEKAERLKNDPSGFYDAKTEISLSWNEITRTLTINKIGASFSFFIRGIKYTKATNESITIPNTTGSYFIYYDLVNDIPTLQFQSTFTVDLILEKTYVAFLYWNATQSSSVPDLQIETHGSSMSGEEHLYNHTSNGTAYISGLGLSFDTTGTGTGDGQTRFTSASGVIADEDLQHIIPSKNSIDNFPIIYRFGTEWRVNKSNNLIGIKGTNYPFYNQNNAGNWQLTEMSANNYGIIYIFASPGITQKWFILMGQNQYGNINAATDASKIYPNLGNLPLQEFKLVGSAIFDVKSTYANTLKSAIQKLSTGADYYDWRKTSIAGQEASIMSSDIIFLQNQIDSKQAIPTDIKKLYVSGGVNGSGNDSNNGFSELSPLNTLAAANTKANGTGVAICMLPSQLTESITFTHANLQVSGFTHRANSGTSGTITADPASGSQTYSTLTIGTFEKIGANGCNLRDVTISTALNDTGSGFLDIINSDLSITPLTFTGVGIKRLYNCRGGRPTVNNANAFVYIVNNQNVANPTLTAGTLALENCIVYVPQGETLTLGTAGATISLNNVRFIYPDITSTEAIINIPTGVLYSFAGTNLYKSTSTINGTDISSLSSSFIQNVKINTLNLPNRTASQRLETDANKNVVSVAKNTADNQNYSTTVGDIKANGTGSLGSLSTLPRADHIHPTDTTREAIANKVSAFSATPNNTNFPTEKLVKDSLDLKLNSSLKGAINGLAELGLDGKVPSAQLPSYVDDVLEYDNLAAFPATGETGKIYIAKDTNITYRWSGTQYIEISSSLALGETPSTAYRGDRGKSAYDHSQITSGNPHNTTKTDIGLGNVDNTSDATKNVLSAAKLTFARNINGVSFDGTSNITISDETKEPAFTKNTAFNKNFGSSANTVTQGNDARLGTKNIDEANIADNRILVYNSVANKIEYQDKPSTNLSIANKTSTTLDIASDTGSDATVPQATITEAGLLIATDKVKLNNTSGTNSGDQDLSGLLTKSDNLNSVADKQASINNISQVASASSGAVFTKDANGNASWVAPSGGGNMSATGITGATGKALVSYNDSMTNIGPITTAAQKQSYAKSSGGTANLTTTERDLLTWQSGDIIYNTTYFRLEKYNGTSWVSTDGTVGNIAFFDSTNSPLHYQVGDGSQVSRTGVYSELWALNSSVNPSLTSSSFTISIANPAVVSKTAHGLNDGERVRFTTTGALPTGVTTGVDYIVNVIDLNNYNLATTVANALAQVYVATSGTQNGTHSYTNTLWGQGNGTTTQNLPDFRGLFLRATDTSRLINSNTFASRGSVDGDAIRNIVGKVNIGFENSPSATGAFFQSNNSGDGVSGGGLYFANINFDASRVVPTADENRPKNYTSTLYIKYL